MTRKLIPEGFLDRQGNIPRALSCGLEGIVIDVPWAALERTPDVYNLQYLHDKIEEARAVGLYVTLRVTAGEFAPVWLKALGSMELTNYTSGNIATKFTVPKWWEPQVLIHWTALQQVLAAEFDADPLVRQIQCCMVMLAYPETTVRWPLQGNKEVMLRAGLTWAKDRAAMVAQVAAMEPWHDTWVALACNPVEYIDPTISGRSAAELSLLINSWLDICPHLLLQNHGLGREVVGERLAMYSNFKAMQVAHPQQVAVTFQTQTLARLDTPPAVTLASCFVDAGRYNGSAVELPVGYDQRYTKGQYDQLRSALFTPPPPPPPPPVDDPKAIARAYVEGAFFGDGNPRSGATTVYTMRLNDSVGLKAIKDYARVAGIPYTVTVTNGIAVPSKNFPPNFLPANPTPITTPHLAGAFIAGFIPGEGNAQYHYVGDDPDPDHRQVVIDACALLGVEIRVDGQKMVMPHPEQLNNAYKAGLIPVKTWHRWPAPPHP